MRSFNSSVFVMALIVAMFCPVTGRGQMPQSGNERISSFGKITGEVFDAGTGQNIAGTIVALEGTVLSGIADQNGIYTITNVPAGTYTLVVTAVGFETVAREVTVSADLASDQNVAMKPFGTKSDIGWITGRVIDAGTGSSIVKAAVTLKGTYLIGIADQNGKYTITNVPAGSYTLVVTAVGFETVLVDNVTVKVYRGSEQNVAMKQLF